MPQTIRVYRAIAVPVSLLLAATLGVGAWALAQPPATPPAHPGEKPGEKPGEEADEEVIEFSKAPTTVRAGALKLIGPPGEKAIRKVIKEEDEGVLSYEIEYTADGAACSAVFSAAGDLMESETPVAEAKLPPAVVAALRKTHPDATLSTPQLVSRTFYEVQVLTGGKTHEVRVNAAGKIEAAAPPEGDEPDAGKDAPGDDGFRRDFPVPRANLGLEGSNPFMTLKPGIIGVYHDGPAVLTVTALDETRTIDGVTTRVVEEREVSAGKPVETSRNYFAIDKATGDVYYFGEDVDVHDATGKVSHPGVWHSGVDGARFGLFLPAKPRVGDKFYQEIAPRVAMDRVEVVSLDEAVETPAGTFKGCLHVHETTPLEPDHSDKWFAPGVGLVKDGKAVLAERPGAKR